MAERRIDWRIHAGCGSQAFRAPRLRQLSCERKPGARTVAGWPIWVRLESGATVVADDAYIEESILKPAAKVTRGYEPIMPTFRGQISEEGVFQIIAYLRSLRTNKTRVEP